MEKSTPVQPKGTFRDFVLSRRPRDGIIGDFVADVRWDNDFPECYDKATVKNYLTGRRACSGAMDAFEALWKRYRSWR